MNIIRNKKIYGLVSLCLAAVLVLGACSFPGRKTNNTAENTENTAPEVPAEETLTLTVKEIQSLANKSSGLWEMMCYMFPNHVVHRSGGGTGFTLDPINRDLPQNKYDWEDLSGALKGIDVSSYQGKIDWKAVAASGNADFAFLRVGYRGWGSGTMVQDERFAYNAQNALANDIPIGVYFVTKAINAAEAKEEAEWIIDKIKGYKVTWPVVMDFEGAADDRDRTWGMTSETRTEIIISFCETLKDAGYTPMLYGSVGTYMAKMDVEKTSVYNKWFAQYFNAPHFGYAFQIWQATDSGKVDGITVNVDIDYSMYDFGRGIDAADSRKVTQDIDNTGEIKDNSVQVKTQNTTNNTQNTTRKAN